MPGYKSQIGDNTDDSVELPTSGDVEYPGQRDNSELGKVVYPMGKHKGKTIAQIANEAPSYLEWVRDNVEKEVGNTVRAFLEQNPGVISMPGSYVLAFGKHKGLSFYDLEAEGEIDYIEWCAKNLKGIARDKAKAYLGHDD